jgi:hypothetical protein
VNWLLDRSRPVNLRYCLKLKNCEHAAGFELPWPPGAPMFVFRRFAWLKNNGYEFRRAE